mmetsp:Transcript_59683/g.126402  ORF Transcript_59683/g.126402 Transcript_59683/m.126402 type:complete len:243 (+) Transcript_59683:414-1142(+)
MQVSISKGADCTNQCFQVLEFQQGVRSTSLRNEQSTELMHLVWQKLCVMHSTPFLFQLVPVPQLVDHSHEPQEIIEVQFAIAILVCFLDDLLELRPQLRIGRHGWKDGFHEIHQLMVPDSVALVLVVLKEGVMHEPEFCGRISPVLPDLKLKAVEELSSELEKSAHVQTILVDFVDPSRHFLSFTKAPDAPECFWGCTQRNHFRSRRVTIGVRSGIASKSQPDGLPPLLSADSEELSEFCQT